MDKTFLISDVHLGSKVSRAKVLHQLLDVYESEKMTRLILLGDIFDGNKLGRLPKDHWKVISKIRALSDQYEIVWVRGNHDWHVAEIMADLIGVPLVDEYVWTQNGKRFCAIHGHQFDVFLTKNVIISEIASAVYYGIQKFDMQNQKLARGIKQLSKGWLRLADEVAKKAIHHSMKHHYDVVICGHTHKAGHQVINGHDYYNTGCCTDIPSHYIIIDGDGVRVEDVL